MTTLQVTLSDDLARKAEARRLLSPDAIAELLEQEMRRHGAKGLSAIMDKLHAVDDDSPKTAEQVRALVQKEIEASRLENASNSCR